MPIYHNITGSTGVTVELIAPDEIVGARTILFTNVHASNDATVTLFVQNDPISGTTNTYNILHTVAIPADSSLFLDNPDSFPIEPGYGLYITVGSSDTVDVLISS